MWLFTPVGFFSVVAHRDKKKTVLVRARCRQDLLSFRKRYCKKLKPIRFLDWSDYPYRAEASRWAFAHAMFRLALDLTYTNFKSAVRDNPRHNLYMDVWTKLRDGERSGGFGSEIREQRQKRPRYYGGRSFGGHVYTPTVVTGTKSEPRTGGGQRNLFDDIHDPRGFDGEDDYGWGDTRVMGSGDLTAEEREQCENPFFWKDETGRTSDDSDDEDVESEVHGALEFDSLGAVIDHFRKKDDD